MKTLTLLLFAVLLTVADQPAAQHVPDIKGITAKVKLEEVVSGHPAVFFEILPAEWTSSSVIPPKA